MLFNLRKRSLSLILLLVIAPIFMGYFASAACNFSTDYVPPGSLFVSPVGGGNEESAQFSRISYKQLGPPSSPVVIFFLHGWLGESDDLVPLARRVLHLWSNQGKITSDLRLDLNGFPNNLGLERWATNIAQRIRNRLKDMSDTGKVIIVGYSMGGKAALYAVGHNISDIRDSIDVIITINTPYHDLAEFAPALLTKAACQAAHFWKRTPDRGACEDLVHHDSTDTVRTIQDETDIPIYALASSEDMPLSLSCNSPIMSSPVDPYAWYLDDGNVPLKAQSVEGVKTIYYGNFCHWDLLEPSSPVLRVLAREILKIASSR